MPNYNAPLRDMRYVLKDVLEVEQLWASLPGLADVIDMDTADAILEEAGKISSEVIAPLNREADEQGSTWHDGAVTSPEGFKEAYQTFSEGGWGGLGGNPEFGGMGMPKTLVAQVDEMVQGASIAFGLAPMLTSGACLSLNVHGSDALKEKYLPNMYAGTWAGAMDLTEPHAGTDLGIIRTRAEPKSDGSYSITGTKIFITWGEHDMAENIIHLVLAKLPGAPAGPKGISLFLVPKLLVSDDGVVGGENGVSCGSIEKKMGIHGSATCVMNFDDAQGWLIGEENQGLACMFTMMNYERLIVGVQALGASEASYQSARDYAKERLQSRSAGGPVEPEKMADPIIVHPDVRRMLMSMKAFNEGGRAFSTYVASWLDRVKFSEDEADKKHAEGMVALLTPVAKAFISDKSFDCAVQGQQVFGGHGYVREWGQEQLVRDIRITQIYEGTNGIQAMDLMGRKVVLNGGVFMSSLVQEIQQFIDVKSSPDAAEFLNPLSAVLALLTRTTEWQLAQSKADPYAVGASAVDFLHLTGYVVYAYMWARMALCSQALLAEDEAFHSAKIGTARFFFQRLLPQSNTHAQNIASGSDATMALSAEQF
jgi:alkylation response protein AidB-like acyl-CoA dehydrogenase